MKVSPVALHKPLLLLLLGGLSTVASAQSYDVKTEQDIRETALRYQFQHNSSGLQKNASSYFVAVGREEKDPTNAFLKRFKGHMPTVRKVSQSKRGQASQVQDKITGKPGLVFFTSDLQWLGPNKARINAGYGEANLSAGVNTYIVEKRGRKWSVTQDIPGPVA